MKVFALLLTAALATVGFQSHAQQAPDQQVQTQDNDDQSNFLEELDPFDPNAEQILQAYDAYYEQQTGMSAHLPETLLHLASIGNDCRREACGLWADVVRSEQRLYLYEQGRLIDTWPVSTGIVGRATPNFERHPDGRIYQRYSSNKFPGGDYNGLGNMPYAVFIQGGFAIHGTPRGNWPNLGRRASHGCVRVHPDHAKLFNQLVRGYGIENVWITVEEVHTVHGPELGKN